MSPARIAKFLTALAGAGAQVIALGLVDGPAESWLSVAIGVLTAAAVFLVPNGAPVPAPGNPGTPAAD